MRCIGSASFEAVLRLEIDRVQQCDATLAVKTQCSQHRAYLASSLLSALDTKQDVVYFK
jgi:hypothetical protein